MGSSSRASGGRGEGWGSCGLFVSGCLEHDYTDTCSNLNVSRSLNLSAFCELKVPHDSRIVCKCSGAIWSHFSAIESQSHALTLPLVKLSNLKLNGKSKTLTHLTVMIRPLPLTEYNFGQRNG